MDVPFVDLSRLLGVVRDDVLREWAACLDGCELAGGRRVAALEGKLAGALGIPHVATCGNGSTALILALQAAGIGRGAKVALPNLTFWATFEAVVQVGAVPVLVDVDPDDLQTSFDALRDAHDAHRFDAVLFVHLYGWTSARLRDIRAFCAEREIVLVEDGAQCAGVEALGGPVLAGAPLSTLSFYPAKVLGGAMDGGAVGVQSAEQAALVRSLRNHGRSAHYHFEHVGWNSRMGELQAAFLTRVLDELPAVLASRRASAAFYRERLAEDARIRVYGPPPGVVENGYLNVLAVEGRAGDDVVAALAQAGIRAARTYPGTMDEQPPARRVGALLHGDLRHSRRLCREVVNLPLFHGMRPDELEACARALLAAVR